MKSVCLEAVQGICMRTDLLLGMQRETLRRRWMRSAVRLFARLVPLWLIFWLAGRRMAASLRRKLPKLLTLKKSSSSCSPSLMALEGSFPGTSPGAAPSAKSGRLPASSRVWKKVIHPCGSEICLLMTSIAQDCLETKAPDGSNG